MVLENYEFELLLKKAGDVVDGKTLKEGTGEIIFLKIICNVKEILMIQDVEIRFTNKKGRNRYPVVNRNNLTKDDVFNNFPCKSGLDRAALIPLIIEETKEYKRVEVPLAIKSLDSDKEREIIVHDIKSREYKVKIEVIEQFITDMIVSKEE